MSGLFASDFFAHLGHRQAMWQMMLGGVFDRHPKLKLMLTEVRADWIPATLQFLDRVFEEHLAELPSARKPSEWWDSNGLAGVSFMHKSEVEMRDEIGVEHMSFGRDYPHGESTWPNTLEYLHSLFSGVPEGDVRKMLGENIIGFLDLDAAKLDAIRGSGSDRPSSSSPGPASSTRRCSSTSTNARGTPSLSRAIDASSRSRSSSSPTSPAS